MFTGIVSATGRVVERRPGRLAVYQPDLARRLDVGASVAVNGACLTVVQVEGDTFSTDVVPETQSRTNLGRLQSGDQVNLELPVTAAQGLDGHVVQGHVDAVAEVMSVKEVELGREIRFQLPRGLAPYIAEKGSVTLDGISLTVADVDDTTNSFAVALIPHTLEHTIARSYVPGTVVNLEVDVLARYVARVLQFGGRGGRL